MASSLKTIYEPGIAWSGRVARVARARSGAAQVPHSDDGAPDRVAGKLDDD